MKQLLVLPAVLALAATGFSQQVPELFAGLLGKDELVKGEVILVLPPQEMEKHVAKMEAAAKKDPEWYAKYAKEAKPGVPLPYHEKLGLTKEEYDDYLKLWARREFRPVAQVILQLREGKQGDWSVSATGAGNLISTLRYLPKEDAFQSPNGKLTRISDIDADPQSILGGWKGREWKFEEAGELGKTKENFAVGRTTDGKSGLLVYRMQEVSTQGTRLYDKSVVIRFPLGAAGKVVLPPPPGGAKGVSPSTGETGGKTGSGKTSGGKAGSGKAGSGKGR